MRRASRRLGDLLSRPAWIWLISRVRVGSAAIRFPNGKTLRRAGSAPGPSAGIVLHRPWSTLRKLFTSGGVGFADSYLVGDWDTDNLASTLEVAGRNVDTYVRADRPSRLIEPTRRMWQRLTGRRKREIESIDRHYNLGNAFYESWLDPSMTYSSAVFDSADQTLEAAQREKYRRLVEVAGITAAHHVLEIGCGWGGFAEYAAAEVGCRVTGLTLSTEQADYARDRLKEAGLDHLVDIKLQDFRKETGRYDRVVSIEMIESIPADLWPPLFKTISEVLPPGGRVAMQSITIAEDLYESLLRREDFISKHVFPGGALPSLQALRTLGVEHGLIPSGPMAYGDSYAETLHRWGERFDRVWPELAGSTLDERFRRLWSYYLAYCEAGFRIGRIDVHQIGYIKGGSAAGGD